MDIYSQECKVCDGKGIMFTGKDYWERCNKCFGKGKLDWIENVTGPSEENIPTMQQLRRRSKKIFRDLSAEDKKYLLR